MTSAGRSAYTPSAERTVRLPGADSVFIRLGIVTQIERRRTLLPRSATRRPPREVAIVLGWRALVKKPARQKTAGHFDGLGSGSRERKSSGCRLHEAVARGSAPEDMLAPASRRICPWPHCLVRCTDPHKWA